MHTSMSFLVDTNFIVTAEHHKGPLEPRHESVSAFLKLANEHEHRIYVHPASLEEFDEIPDQESREHNLAAYKKYVPISEIVVTPEVASQFPTLSGLNDQRDARILTALHVEAVSFLITDDEKLLKRATRMGLGERVLRAREAASQLRAWHPGDALPPPNVEQIPAYQIDDGQEIFRGLERDYPGFKVWLRKVKIDFANRKVWISRNAGGIYDAIAILKTEDRHPRLHNSTAMKLCTFKVADHAAGRRLGELLLKAVLRWAADQPGTSSEMFVEVLPQKEQLLNFLHEFGFASESDDGVYVKQLEAEADSDLDGFQHHKRYGPPALRAGQPIFVIPIRPIYFEGLFPDAVVVDGTGQLMLPGTSSNRGVYGDSIRKAYISRANRKRIPAGATLLFYRSQDKSKAEAGVAAVGVCERSVRSDESRVTIEASFKRTVLSVDQVEALHSKRGEVLTVLFRHDRLLDPTWLLSSLKRNKVLRGPPQAISQVRDEDGIKWVEDQLTVWR